MLICDVGSLRGFQISERSGDSAVDAAVITNVPINQNPVLAPCDSADASVHKSELPGVGHVSASVPGARYFS